MSRCECPPEGHMLGCPEDRLQQLDERLNREEVQRRLHAHIRETLGAYVHSGSFNSHTTRQSILRDVTARVAEFADALGYKAPKLVTVYKPNADNITIMTEDDYRNRALLEPEWAAEHMTYPKIDRL